MLKISFLNLKHVINSNFNNEWQATAIGPFLYNHCNIATEGSNSDVGTIFYSNRRVFFRAQWPYLRKCCKLLMICSTVYMHNIDDNHPTWPGFETSTSEFWVTTGPTQQTQYVESRNIYSLVESILGKRWSTVYDAGPTLNQHRFNVLCPLVYETCSKLISIKRI